jgi:hypothetical protein
MTNRSLPRRVAVLQLAADQSEYAASILSRRPRLLPGLMWDLDKTPLPGGNGVPEILACHAAERAWPRQPRWRHRLTESVAFGTTRRLTPASTIPAMRPAEASAARG